jgi:hypothetical protein
VIFDVFLAGFTKEMPLVGLDTRNIGDRCRDFKLRSPP